MAAIINNEINFLIFYIINFCLSFWQVNRLNAKKQLLVPITQLEQALLQVARKFTPFFYTTSINNG
jgi:cytochrome oxidase assembly protein ShyY1